jgi:MFS family permease
MPDVNPRTQRYLPWIVASALFMEQMDATIVNTGIPAMAADLGTTPLALKAVSSSYVLALAMSIPASGWLANRFGTRRIFLSAIVVFTLASLACGLAPSVAVLVACRVLQGMSAAMMMPVGRMTLVRSFPKSQLLQAMNFMVIPALMGPLLGPTVGGLIVHWGSWREMFFVNVPVGLAALVFGLRHMPDYRAESSSPSTCAACCCSAVAPRCCPGCWRCSAPMAWAMARPWPGWPPRPP